MPYVQYKTKTSTFFHNPSDNGLYDQNKQPLTPYNDPPPSYASRFGTLHKDKDPYTLKVSLGQGCNYSCGYCLQKDIGNPNERPVNGMIGTLIANINRHLDVSKLQRFELWGGETFLYWNDIKQLIEQYDRPGLTWYLPTNGTPLHSKHLDFFAQMRGNVAMGISHDGPAHQLLRGKEFIHKKVDLFHRIQAELPDKVQYSFNPVISKQNYDLFAINEFFLSFFEKYGLRYKQLTFELGRTYDTTMTENSANHVITGADLVLYQHTITQYLQEHTNQYYRLGETTQGPLLANNLFHTGMGVLPLIRSMQHRQPRSSRTNCGVDDSKNITLDMSGSVRTCQNVDDTHNSGTLMFRKYIKIKNVDLDRTTRCGSCDVRHLCKSSCPLVLSSNAFDTNCKLQKIHYRAIQQAALNILFPAQDVTRVEG